jgi:hypothetical protein
MNKIFIVDIHKNDRLLKFVQTKIFFDAKNNGVHWAKDVEIIDDVDDINDSTGIIINSNQVITTNFRNKYPTVDTLIDARADTDLIEFDPEYSYSMAHRPPFAAGSKQLYILENLYKVVLRSKKLIYLNNTEDFIIPTTIPSHFYGLASGWKSVSLVKHLGVSNLKSITIYDKCQRQLDYQKFLHSQEQLPADIIIDPPYYGEYNPPADIKEFWPVWHRVPVNFEILDLFQIPTFPIDSLVWVSNVFQYEPAIFEYGWEECKNAKQRLIMQNKSCTII